MNEIEDVTRRYLMKSANASNRIKRKVTNVFFLILFFLFVLSKPGICRMREAPKSFTAGCLALNKVECVEVDKSSECEDQEKARPVQKEGTLRSQPHVFAQCYPVDICTNNNGGTWEELEDCSHLWRVCIFSGGAMSLNLGITTFNLPEDAKLWIYNYAADYVEGPYTGKDGMKNELWTPMIPGAKIVTEIYVPPGIPKETVDVCITKANHGFRDMFGPRSDVETRASCNVDVLCPAGEPWRDQIRSVAHYTINGTEKCSGVLLNNTSGNFVPFFLTACHCKVNEQNAHTMVLYWNHQSPNCSECLKNSLPGSLADNQVGAIFLASWKDDKGSDFALVMLKDRPDPLYNVYYSGWDATGDIPESAVCIHHPIFSEKSINYSDYKIASTGKESKESLGEGYYWYIEKWRYGTIQDGSSGSGLWDALTGLCIGQLWGGEKGCNDQCPCKPGVKSNWYGKFSAGWQGGGTPDTQLKYWLDPCKTGKCRIEGVDPLYSK
jgi:lysyl endopeptidase